MSTYDANGNRTNVTSGSWFAMDYYFNKQIYNNEKSPLSQGSEGIIIGAIQAAGTPTHSGAPYASDWNRIDAPYNFFGNTGEEFTSSPIRGGTNGLDFSGWHWSWNGNPSTSLGIGAWAPQNCGAIGLPCAGYTSGVALFSWDKSGNYVLNYAATIPNSDPTGFGGVHYFLHLEGTVKQSAICTPEGTGCGIVPNPDAVPLPAAFWLLGSGLAGLASVARYRKSI